MLFQVTFQTWHFKCNTRQSWLCSGCHFGNVYCCHFKLNRTVCINWYNSLSYSAVKAKKLRRGVGHGAFTPLEVLSATSFLPLDTPQPQPITYLFLSRSSCSDSFVKTMKFARPCKQLPVVYVIRRTAILVDLIDVALVCDDGLKNCWKDENVPLNLPFRDDRSLGPVCYRSWHRMATKEGWVRVLGSFYQCFVHAVWWWYMPIDVHPCVLATSFGR